MVAKIKDRAIRDNYAARLSGLIGFWGSSDEEKRVLDRVRAKARADDRGRPGGAESVRAAQPAVDQLDESIVSVEREVLKVALQLPAVAGPQFDALGADTFLHPAHRALRTAIDAAGGTGAAVSGPGWTAAVERHLDEGLRPGMHRLAVDPLRAGSNAAERYADGVLARMHEIVAGRHIVALKSRLQRINPQEEQEEYKRLFGELVALERYRRGLLERAIGGL